MRVLFSEGQEGWLIATVSLVERLGSETIFDVHRDTGEKLIVALSEDRVVGVGSPIRLKINPGKALLFARP